MKISILDQSPISNGKTAKEALNASVKLAQTAEKLGYTRYWIAEHHDMKGLACPSPDVMLGVIGAQTNIIRIGAGAVLLPHYKPYRVAEKYNLLATLFPDRLDLGIGRAPGGSAEATMALSDNFLEQVRQHPEYLDDLLHFIYQSFPKDHMFSKISPSPVPLTPPKPWLLGTSNKSAILAAKKGMPYTFGHFMSSEYGPAITEEYYKNFLINFPDKQPEAIVTINVICAETTAEAEELALSSQLWSVQQMTGEGHGIPSISEAKTYSYSEEEIKMIKKNQRQMIIGNPKEVKTELLQLQKLYNVDEFMIVTITHDYAARERSYELLAEELLKVK